MNNVNIEYETDCKVCGGINCKYCKKDKAEPTTTVTEKEEDEA